MYYQDTAHVTDDLQHRVVNPSADQGCFFSRVNNRCQPFVFLYYRVHVSDLLFCRADCAINNTIVNEIETKSNIYIGVQVIKDISK